MRPSLKRSSFVLCFALGCVSSEPALEAAGAEQDRGFDQGFEMPAPRPSAPPSQEEPVALSYEADIRPIFEEHCVICHDADGPLGAEHDIDLTSFDNVVSVFDEAISEIQGEKMPPDGLPLLSPEEIETLLQWAEEGFAP